VSPLLASSLRKEIRTAPVEMRVTLAAPVIPNAVLDLPVPTEFYGAAGGLFFERAQTYLVRADFEVITPAAHTIAVEACVRDQAHSALLCNRFLSNVARAEQLRLCEGARRIFDTPNAGGASVWSEALSFELMAALFGAKLTHTEMEIEYFPMGGSITDYCCEMLGHRVGVSVTRAMRFAGGCMTSEEATALLTKKLSGVNASTSLVLRKQRWHKQILHVWAASADIATAVSEAWEALSDELKSNTIVMITTAEGESARYIFYNS